MLEYTLFNSKYCKNVGILIWLTVTLVFIYSCGLAPANGQNPANSEQISGFRNAEESTDNSSAPFSASVTPLESRLGSSKGTPEELNAVWEAWALLNRDHVDRDLFNADDFEEFAIKGMIAAVDDPYTSYIEPAVMKIEQQDLSGEFEGIGAHVRRREDGAIQIISPIEGGPAESAGILSGDIIVAVDGEEIGGLPLLEAVTKIRGPRGSLVVLTIKRLGQLQTTEIDVIRDVIALPSVLLRSEPGSDITHIRITEFKADTPDRLKEVLLQEIDGGAEGLILDLRSNPGGYLQQVFEIADMFLNEEVILVEERQDKEVLWESKDGGLATDLPVVLLVNAYSASGSEILMGAFQDSGRSQVVGEKTFGKGTVNIFRELSNGGGLYMSIGRWYTPMKRQIEGEGLLPDFEVTDTDPQKADIMQVEKAIELLENLISVDGK
tara:strand:+ start:2656 stop:3969 length:1314 start_codon:yes stop_codon:yes gene_type:complete